MTLNRYISAIELGLSQTLPGWKAQKQMAPEINLDIRRNDLIQDRHREGAVLILLYPGENKQSHIVFIRRPEYDGVHSGQIALPGGTREPNETLETTALREAHEEVGVSAADMTLLGTLTPTYIPPSNFMVYPYIAYQKTRPTFRASVDEVAEIVEAPLALLLNPETRQTKMWNTARFSNLEIPFYNVYGHHVWGATAIIISEFVEIVRNNL